MQQRRVRLGDILDDYCPRERRITNHAVVAMIEDEVKQTRCTTCDADHEYKQAKVPSSRRKKPEPALVAAAGTEAAAFARPPVSDPEPSVIVDEALDAPLDLLEDVPVVEASGPNHDPEPDPESESEPEAIDQPEDEWPVHRPLIRATLPRPEGQVPERKAPDFTIRQNSRFDGRNGNNRHRGQRQAQGQSRFGNPRSGGSGQGQGQGPSGHGQRHGNRPGGGPQGQGGQRGGGRPPGHGRGPGGGGRGPKRGR
jgi:hypothetical protein